MKVSHLFGKKVISTQGKEGYVISVNAADGKLECLICADENEREFAVDVKNILSAEEKIVFDDRDTAIKKAAPLRLGRAGFDEKGNFLGTLEEFTVEGNRLLKAKIGKKTYPAEVLIFGDVIIVKNMRRLKSDVIKDGKVLIKKGTPLTDDVAAYAQEAGELVQANLKTL